jgi:NitT/TauT family transport system permease protein
MSVTAVESKVEISRGKATASPARQIAIGRVLVLLVGLAVWQGCVSAGWLDPYYMSSPVAVGLRLWEMTLSGALFVHVGVTTGEMLLGFLLGAVLGIGAGMLLAFGRIVPAVLDPYIMAFYSMPRVALAPLFVVWFGIGMVSKVAVTASLVVFLCLFSTYNGMRLTDAALLQAVKSLGATKSQLLWKVRVPYAIPWIIAGLKTSVGMALVGAVIGELIAASRGLGWYISYAMGLFDTTGVMTGLVVLMLMSIVLNELLSRLEARLLNWKPDMAI